MLVALPYFLIAYACLAAVADGGPGWLHLVVLWACWNALKFLIMGPVSVVLLVRVLLHEATIRRHQRREASADADTRVPGSARLSQRPAAMAEATSDRRPPPGRITMPWDASARRAA